MMNSDRKKATILNVDSVNVSVIFIGLVCFTPSVDCIHLGAVSGAGQTGICLEIGLDNFFLRQNEL